MMRDQQRAGIALIVRPDRLEAALWRELRATGAAKCRERLFGQYRHLARSLAIRQGRDIGAALPMLRDLEQAGYQGLLQAIDRFDPARGVPFPAYARVRIRGSIRDSIAELSEYGAQQDYRRRAERERLRSLQAGSPSGAGRPARALDQLADLAAGLALSLMLDAQARQQARALSGDLDNGFDSLAWRQTQTQLAREVSGLPEPERSVIRQHYENDVLFAHIATMLGVSRGRVSQLHKAAIQRLLKRMKPSR